MKRTNCLACGRQRPTQLVQNQRTGRSPGGFHLAESLPIGKSLGECSRKASGDLPKSPSKRIFDNLPEPFDTCIELILINCGLAHSGSQGMEILKAHFMRVASLSPA